MVRRRRARRRVVSTIYGRSHVSGPKQLTSGSIAPPETPGRVGGSREGSRLARTDARRSLPSHTRDAPSGCLSEGPLGQDHRDRGLRGRLSVLRRSGTARDGLSARRDAARRVAETDVSHDDADAVAVLLPRARSARRAEVIWCERPVARVLHFSGIVLTIGEPTLASRLR